MAHKKFNLFLISILIIMLFFSIPIYHNWLNEKILANNVSIFFQMKHQSIEFRKEYRYENTYIVVKKFIAILKANNAVNPVILIPPNDYLIKNGVSDFVSLEPAIFYYYLGLKTVGVNSPNVTDAKWVLVVQNNKGYIRRIKNKEDFQQLMVSFSPPI